MTAARRGRLPAIVLAVVALAAATVAAAARAEQPEAAVRPGPPAATAQAPMTQAQIPRPPMASPVVHDDGRVTVTLVAPEARSVTIAGAELRSLLGADSLRLTRNDQGIWTGTIGPLEPGIYDYGLAVDGLVVVDPLGPGAMGGRTGVRGVLEVPGRKGTPRIDQWQDVPHGAVTRHWYESKATGTRRSLHVYTPPGYPADGERYPVVYLLHGSGDDDRHWSELGRANVIADNLIAGNRCVPPIIVMPDGHPAGGPPRAKWDSAEAADYALRNGRLVGADLLGDVIPLVESRYRTQADRGSRAIVGLSMGGRQALDVGLGHLDMFAAVGSFSGAANCLDGAIAAVAADPAAANRRLDLLWIGIGRDDFLLASNREFTARLREIGIRHDYEETDGGHSWSLWRRYLAGILPRLFRGTVAVRPASPP